MRTQITLPILENPKTLTRNMKKVFGTLILILFAISSYAQTYEYVYRNPQDSSYNCYLKIIPEGEVKGMIVRDFSSLPDMNKPARFQLHKLAAEEGILTLVTVTSNNFPELYIDETRMDLLDEIIAEAVEKYKVPKDKIVMGGISASGTRAVKYAQYCAAGKSKNNIHIAAVFAVDSPLDFQRFWKEEENALNRNFNENAVWEANKVLPYFTQWLGGSPYDNLEKYYAASPFCYTAKEGGNAYLLKHTPIRFYTEPDIQWWIKVKRKDYYNFNSIDAAAFHNQLLLMGNEQSELITTTDKGYLKDGSKHPHSWSIVDEEELMDWILAKL